MHSCIEKLFRTRDLGWIADLTRRAYRSPVGRVLCTNALVLLFGLTNSVLLSRWLGPQGRGELAAAMLWPSLLMFLSSMGLIQAITYYSALPGAAAPAVWRSSSLLALGQSPVGIAVGYAAIPWLLAHQPDHVVAASRLYLFVIPPLMLSQYASSLLQGRMQFDAMNQLRLILPTGYLAGVLVLYAAGGLKLLNIVILHVAINVLVLIVAAVHLARYKLVQKGRFDRQLAGDLVSYGVKVYAGELTGTVNLRLDQMVLAAWFAPAQLGLYVAAVSAAGLTETVSTAFRLVTSPRIAAQSDEAGRRHALVSLFRKYILASSATVLTLAVALPFAIPWFFGRSFAPAVLVAEILLLANLCISARNVLAAAAQALGDPWLNSAAEIAALPVTVITLLMFVPRYGIYGAAMSTVFAYATQLAVVLHRLRRDHSISPYGLMQGMIQMAGGHAQ